MQSTNSKVPPKEALYYSRLRFAWNFSFNCNKEVLNDLFECTGGEPVASHIDDVISSGQHTHKPIYIWEASVMSIVASLEAEANYPPQRTL